MRTIFLLGVVGLPSVRLALSFISSPSQLIRSPSLIMSAAKLDENSGSGSAGTPMPSPTSALSFLRIVGKLKQLKRTGWVHRGVAGPESVADHMYRMAVCSFLVTNATIDRSRVMKLAVVHDLAEALAGDIAPFQKVTKEEKRRLEEEGLEKICATIGSDPIAQEIKDLWLEYENCTTEEARVVKDFDKFEMIVQADEYEQGQGLDLGEFFESTAGAFTTPQVQSWDKELRAQRDNRRRDADPSDP